jgi:hypothetical protein
MKAHLKRKARAPGVSIAHAHRLELNLRRRFQDSFVASRYQSTRTAGPAPPPGFLRSPGFFCSPARLRFLSCQGRLWGRMIGWGECGSRILHAAVRFGSSQRPKRVCLSPAEGWLILEGKQKSRQQIFATGDGLQSYGSTRVDQRSQGAWRTRQRPHRQGVVLRRQTRL